MTESHNILVLAIAAVLLVMNFAGAGVTFRRLRARRIRSNAVTAGRPSAGERSAASLPT